MEYLFYIIPCGIRIVLWFCITHLIIFKGFRSFKTAVKILVLQLLFFNTHTLSTREAAQTMKFSYILLQLSFVTTILANHPTTAYDYELDSQIPELSSTPEHEGHSAKILIISINSTSGEWPSYINLHIHKLSVANGLIGVVFIVSGIALCFFGIRSVRFPLLTFNY